MATKTRAVNDKAVPAKKQIKPKKTPAKSRVEKIKDDNIALLGMLHTILRNKLARCFTGIDNTDFHVSCIRVMTDATYGNHLFSFLDSIPNDIENLKITDSYVKRTHAYVTENGETVRKSVRASKYGLNSSADVLCAFNESMFKADDSFDPVEGLYPSARHLLMTCLYIKSADGLLSETLDLEVPDASNPTDVVCRGFADLSSMVDFIFNRSVGLPKRYYRNPLKSSNLFSDYDVGYLTFSFEDTGDGRYLPIYIDDLVSGEANFAKRIAQLDLSRAVTKHLESSENQYGEMRSVITDCLIEGIHFNRHRFDEVRPFVREFDMSYGQALEAMKDSLLVNQVRVDLDGVFQTQIFSKISSDAKPFVVSCGSIRFADNPIAALLAIETEGKEYTLTDAEIEDRAVEYSVNVLKRDRAEIRSEIMTLNKSLMEQMSLEAKLTARINTYRKYNRECLEELKASVSKMSIFEKVETLTNFSLALQTQPIFASPNVDLGECSHSKNKRNQDDGRRYVGVYQILIEPITGSIQIRNIKAPIIVTQPGYRLDARYVATALFHPHSSIDDGQSEVCLGGYNHLLRSRIQDSDESIVETLVTKLRTALQFLQTFSESDGYVEEVYGTLTPTMCENTGITGWQDFSRCSKFGKAPLYVFGLPRQAEYVTPNNLGRSKTHFGGYINMDKFLNMLEAK